MKKSHRRPIAVLLAAAVSLSAFGGLSPASAADSEGKKEVKLIYKIDEDATAGKTTDLSLFAGRMTTLSAIHRDSSSASPRTRTRSSSTSAG